MKKFMIMLLAIGMLFSFAACDNSNSNAPSGDDTVEESPVNFDYEKYAATKANELFYAASDPIIDIADILDNATEGEISFSNGKVTVTKDYTVSTDTVPFVGKITITLDGTYTAPTAVAKDGTLDVDNYNIKADGLKHYSGSKYEVYSFDVTGPISGVTAITVENGTTVKDITADSAVAYTALPSQNVSLSLAVPVAFDTDGTTPTKVETRTYDSANFKDNLAVVAASKSAKSYMQTVLGDFLGDVKANDTALVAMANKLIGGGATPATDEEKAVASAVVKYAPGSVDESYKESGVVTIEFTGKGDGYKMGDSLVTGTFVLSFPEAYRQGTGKAPDATVTTVSLGTKFAITGEISVTGIDYPITVSVVKDIKGGDLTGSATATLNADGTVKSITSPDAFGNYTAGTVDVCGVNIDMK